MSTAKAQFADANKILSKAVIEGFFRLAAMYMAEASPN